MQNQMASGTVSGEIITKTKDSTENNLTISMTGLS